MSKVHPIRIRISKPYTLCAQAHSGLVDFRSAAERDARGVYLWCIEYGDAYLVNYVGRTHGNSRRSFQIRIGEELKIWFRPEDKRIDRDLFRIGIRTALPDECNTSACLAKEKEELTALYRIFMVPLETQDEAKTVEGSLLRTLYDEGATRQFLCSHKDKARLPTPLEYGPESPALIGLNGVPVPDSLRDALRRFPQEYR